MPKKIHIGRALVSNILPPHYDGVLYNNILNFHIEFIHFPTMSRKIFPFVILQIWVINFLAFFLTKRSMVNKNNNWQTYPMIQTVASWSPYLIFKRSDENTSSQTTSLLAEDRSLRLPKLSLLSSARSKEALWEKFPVLSAPVFAFVPSEPPLRCPCGGGPMRSLLLSTAARQWRTS